jgi:phospholipid-transporting ATPase
MGTIHLPSETNLKIRQGIPETSHFVSPEEVARLDATIKSELPNNSLYTFEATLKWGAKELPLSPQQLLLRGAQLKNTRWVYGVAVFTGHETKLMMNSTTTPVKRTKVEKMVNSQIIFLFFCLLVMALIGAVGQLFAEIQGEFVRGILLKGYPDPNPSFASALFPDFPKNILTYMILFNNLIPLSLIVTVEFVKLFLGTYINSDLDMYYEESDTPATARTSTLIEELGQIDYIFSDKTGTLTRNIMEFKMCSIGGLPYAETVPDDKRLHLDENGQEVGYYDFNRLQKHKESGPNATLIHEFLSLLAVCHTVIPEHDESDPGKLTYQASSPDEAALVDGAKALGYLFHTRKPKSVTIAVQGMNHEYEILTVNEFNSTRKRMSVLVRGPDGKVKLMIKGADTVIYERLAPGCSYMEKTSQHLEDYANDGLRTLVLAYRDVPEFEYQQWQQVYEKASTQINNRQDALDQAAEMIEKDLVLLGATAIEDKLQDGVPDTIHTLMEAGIKVWVLTGDRQETAINIGFSCKLITPEMIMMICNEPTHLETKDYLEKKLAAIKDSMGISTLKKSKWNRFWMGIGKKEGKFDKDVGADIDPLALIIDGKTLTFALEPDIREIFLELAMLCKAVVCCRVSPLQKALVVKLVKKNVAGAVTLAIGDGANDVSMIQAAHVGVGISGQEGLQAARAADFAIGQFRFLRKLLLVHGGWAYSRVTKVIVICFYKNITLYLIQFWFALNNNFSGMTLFETWSQVSSYNVVWTLLPPVAIGIFDQYVSARILDRYPQLYQLGQSDTFYNHKVFLGWIVNSFLHSLLLFYFWSFILGPGDILSGGRTTDNWVFGSMVYVTTLMVVLIKHCLIVDSWVGLTTFAIFGSVAVFMLAFPLVFESNVVYHYWTFAKYFSGIVQRQ